MANLELQNKINVPFADKGDKINVPDTSSEGTVNMTDGFGSKYDTPIAAGGEYIYREEMNDILNKVYAAVKELQDLAITAGFPVDMTKALNVLPIANGGTGANNASQARSNLGLGSLATKSTITSADITDGTITTNDIANGAITSAKILDGTITNADIANATITGAKIANNAVTGQKIANNTITATQLANNAVTTNKIQDEAVTSSKINLSFIEFNPDTSAQNGGFIDFHYNGATTDYTSRIIENSKGLLSVVNSKGMYINNINVPLFNKISIDMTASVDVGTVVQLTAEKGQVTLPSGGTWFVWLFVINAAIASSNALISHLSISAGGTQVGPYNSSAYKLAGLAIRIQ